MPSPPRHSQEEITRGLLAVVAWAGNHTAASRDLGKRGFAISVNTLKRWTAEQHFAEYQRLRDEHAPAVEAQLAHQFRDVAAHAVRVQMLALQAAEKRLEEGQQAMVAVTDLERQLAGDSLSEEARTYLHGERDRLILLHDEVGSEAARTAAFAARTGQSAVDKLMTLTNRPQRIVEQRDVNEVLRSLAAKKVVFMLPHGEQSVEPEAAASEGKG